MGADIYESYVGAMIASIILSYIETYGQTEHYITFPMVLAALGLLVQFVGLASNTYFNGLNLQQCCVMQIILPLVSLSWLLTYLLIWYMVDI